ncbi:MAG: DUF4093 domain-containing protein [Clostridia bacterium]|nr:DUF4093 domain-containing protein [Clostridia bacterium]
MSEKLKISLPILVEGKYDKIKLDSILDAVVLTTGGFGIFNSEEKKALIRRLCKDGVIVLCDSDGAGKVIRGFIGNLVPKDKIVHLYIPQIPGKERRKKTPSKEGTLGVEGIDAQVLRALFEKYADAAAKPKEKLTKADFYALGLSGAPSATAHRDALAAAFDLPRGMSANALLGALSLLASPDEVRAVLEKLQMQ